MYSKPCLFLDRDGIINHDIGYASKPEQMQFIPGIFSLCRFFQRHGYAIIIVTNQSGIARGYYSVEQFHQLSAWLSAQFLIRGVRISDTFFCPHHPSITGPCSCRKPAPGMLLQAIAQYRIDPSRSIMIGDKESDMQAGLNAGIGCNIRIDKDHVQYRNHSVADITLKRVAQIRSLFTN